MAFSGIIRVFCFGYQKKEVARALTIVILALTCCSAKQKTRFLDHPKEFVYRDEGSDVTLRWEFEIESRPPSGTKIMEFLFGEWAYPGYVKQKILYYESNKMDKHPGYKMDKHPGYEEKVDWSGNISNCVTCSAKVTIHNLTRVDFKKYGVNILMGMHRNSLKNWLELRVRPRIKNWLKYLEVNEGNSTTLKCMADGIPSPLVKIQRSNQTLCNNTAICEHTIKETKVEHEGVYECLAQQSKSTLVRRSMKLKVRLKGDQQQSTNTATISTPTATLCLLIAVKILTIVSNMQLS